MPSFLMIPNFDKLQNYRDRDPKWIKLYRDLLTDYEFSVSLSETSQLHLIKLWLLAAQSGNKIPDDEKYLSRHLNCSRTIDLQVLKDGGWLAPYSEDSSSVLFCSKSVQNSTQRREEESREEERREDLSSEPETAHEREVGDPLDEVILVFPCHGKVEEWGMTARYINLLSHQYGKALSVAGEVRQAQAWIRDNPEKRKTARGMTRFIGGWMDRAIRNGNGLPPKTPREERTEFERLKRATQSDKEQKKRHARRQEPDQQDGGGDGIQSVGDILKGDPNAQAPEVHRPPEEVGQQDGAPATTDEGGVQ